ncbi:hypothetical protein FPOAC1_004551 [Fusarium poae]|jgi:hypothetical protein|uniref:hypothetical protein n=1 Tax=Fusarium poae TaxID=36050 RepID=UPI001CEB5C5F|nr:hypothetical protein FPOAC1_004551 [Fusarium poae]KAG8671307.1 hypothetical protein FPOAC1_004551 [Fusarium poae]
MVSSPSSSSSSSSIGYICKVIPVCRPDNSQNANLVLWHLVYVPFLGVSAVEAQALGTAFETAGQKLRSGFDATNRPDSCNSEPASMRRPAPPPHRPLRAQHDMALININHLPAKPVASLLRASA